MVQNLIGAVLAAVAAFMIMRMVLAWRSRISPEEAHRLVEAGAVLLDVRTPREVAAGALPGSLNIPVQSLAGRFGELGKDRAIVVYCASGMRSAKAARMLGQQGYEAHDLGPMRAW